MNILDYLKFKKKKDNAEELKKNNFPGYIRVPNEKEQTQILSERIETLFITDGRWFLKCLTEPDALSVDFIPCHTRDNLWMSRLLSSQLLEEGINIPFPIVKDFMDNSERFNELKHDYELAVVKWLLEWMANGGTGWSMPEGFDIISLQISKYVDKIIRRGAVKTLLSFGFDKEIIEEGIEKYSDIWRNKFMNQAFDHEFNPLIDGRNKPPQPASSEHRQNWIRLREYKYYKEHLESVEKYGKKTDAMNMSEEEAEKLAQIVDAQNKERENYIRTIEKQKYFDNLM